MSNEPAEVNAEAVRRDGSVGAGTLIRGLRRYRFLSILLLAVSVGSGAAVWLFYPVPKLTAYTTFQIAAQPQALFTPVGDDRADFKLYCQAQSVLVKSRPVLEAALEALDASGRHPQILEGRNDQVTWLSSNLQVDFRASPEFMRVSLEGDDAEDTKAVIDAVKTAYVNEVVLREKSRRRAYFKQLESVHIDFKNRLEGQRRTVQQLAEELGSAVPENLALREKFVQEQLGMLDRDLLQTQSEMRRADAESKRAEQRLKGGDPGPVADETLLETAAKEPEYQKLAARRDDARTAVADIKKALTSGARPTALVQAEQRLDEANRELDAFVEKVRPTLTARVKALADADAKRSSQQLQERVAVLKDLEAGINAEVRRLSKKLEESNRGQTALESYRNNMAQTQRMAERVSQELEQLRPELESPPRVSIWEEPNVVPGTEGNRRLKYSLMVAGVALVLSLGLITFLEANNRYVIRPEDAADRLGLRLVGTVPHVPRRLLRGDAAGRKQLTPATWMLTECMDAMRTMLIHTPDAPKTRLTILVASAMPGEGKTVVASQLAASLARAGFPTLLIDGDLRRPTLHRAAGAALTPGFCELLRDAATLEGVTQPTDIPGLTFIPAGAWDARAAQALASNRWPAVKAGLQAEYEYVVIDTSPVLLVPDAMLMARHADGAVLSVLLNVSAVDEVAEARDKFQALGVRVFGVVVGGLTGRKYQTSYTRYARTAAPAEDVASRGALPGPAATSVEWAQP
jgi:capsular exopolysaccharide synthesis family protein